VGSRERRDHRIAHWERFYRCAPRNKKPEALKCRTSGAMFIKMTYFPNVYPMFRL